jgi:hypothetical protein
MFKEIQIRAKSLLQLDFITLPFHPYQSEYAIIYAETVHITGTPKKEIFLCTVSVSPYPNCIIVKKFVPVGGRRFRV